MILVDDLLALAISAAIAFTCYAIQEKVERDGIKKAKTNVRTDFSQEEQSLIDATRQIIIEELGENATDVLISMRTFEERKEVTNRIIDRLNELYGVELTGGVEYFCDQSGLCGGYVPEEDKIMINADFLRSDSKNHLREHLDTIIHEHRHKIQHEAINNSSYHGSGASAETVQRLRDAFDNYIPAGMNLRRYYNNYAEREARGAAEISLRGIAKYV